MSLRPEVEKNPFVYYVPRQILNPLTIFAYWCAHQKGEVPLPEEVKVVNTSLGSVAIRTADYMVPPLFHRNGKQELTDQVSGLPSSRPLKRLVNYLGYCLPNQELYPLATLEQIGASPFLYGMMTIAALRLWREPRLALMAGVQIIDRMIDNGMDAFRVGELGGKDKWVVEELNEVAKDTVAEIQGTMVKMLHQADQGTEDCITIKTKDGDLLKVSRRIGRVAILEGQKISVAVIGPANVGKSTMVANLESASRRLLQSVGMVTEFWSMAVPCRVVDFDASTPDISKIKRGDTGGFSAAEKAAWTDQLAANVVDNFLTADNGVYFISTPGGNPDQITQTLSLPLDGAILLLAAATQPEWDAVYSTWSEVLRNNGVVPLALIRSRQPGEHSRLGNPAENSAITHVAWKQRTGFGERDWLRQVRGRLVGARRQIEIGDLFYADLAKLLFFDLLPGLVIDKYQTALNYAGAVFEKYRHFGG